MKVLLVTNAPTPYRLPLFTELNRQLQQQGIGFRVAFATAGYRRRKWIVELTSCTFDYVVLGSRSFVLDGDTERTTFSYGGLREVIRQYQPSVVIVPGFSLAAVQTWMASVRRGPPYLIWSGSVVGRPQSQGMLRTWQRRLIAARAAGGIAYGSQAAAYLRSLGLPGEKVFVGINTVDTTFFARATDALRETIAPGDGDRKVLTYVGYLSARKNVRLLLEVVRLLASRRSDFVLEIIGDGDDRVSLEHFVAAHQLQDFVRFYGYQQQQELPGFFARSSCFLYQTDFDIWGLVLVEAMAAGVPCLASVNAGATHDLICDGVTGFAVDFSDTATVAARISQLLDDPASAKEVAVRARKFVSDHVTIEKSAAGFVQAIASVGLPCQMQL